MIDEAPNLYRPDPEDAVQLLLTDRIVQIAAEGREYVRWLLLSALFAGGFAPAPILGQMGARLTHEGGGDVAMPLR